MGSPEGYADEKPLRDVTLEAFDISRTEISVGQYRALAPLPSQTPSNTHQPVTFVSRADAERYAAFLSERTGRSCRLPTESEWEYAARLLVDKQVEPPQGSFNRSASPLTSDTGTHSVPPNPQSGAFDFLGNVAEWVQDCYHPNYHGAPTDGSARTDCEFDLAVVRGGSWNDPPHRRTVSARNDFSPKERSDRIGFRIVCEQDR